MDLTSNDTLHLLLAFFLILSAAHSVGFIFQRLHQPAVVGEILGGLLLGPTVLGALLPEVQGAVFRRSQATSFTLGAFYQIGLILLMFCSGLEIRTLFNARRGRSTIAVAAIGTVVPLFIGALIVKAMDLSAQMGEASSETAFLLIFAAAFAVTSIPVISRIFHDLGIMDTPFAKLVLSAALFEDIGLFVLVSMAVAIASGGAGAGAAAQGPGVTGGHDIAQHVFITLAFFGASVLAGPRLFSWIEKHPWNLPARKSPVGFLFLFLFLMTVAALSMGITPMLGAFVAGMIAGGTGGIAESAGPTLQKYAFSFPIPVYFALVGFKLNLIRHFDPIFFLLFFVVASVVKAAGVYVGARWAGESRHGAINLAAAMNARGGPCIVLASVALDAKIISEGFYTVLIVLAITSSMAAGAWLDFSLRRNPSLL